MTPARTFCAESIGHIAAEVLSRDQTVSIVGVTSAGLFLRGSQRWVVFLGPKGFRGPLTISTAASIDGLQLATVGSPGSVKNGSLVLPSANVVICANRDLEWLCSPPPKRRTMGGDRLERLRAIACRALEERRSGLIESIPRLLDLPAENTCIVQRDPLLSEVWLLHDALEHRDMEQTLDIASRSMGAGMGLTPSWDDLLAGLLLVVNRWHDVTTSIAGLNWFNRRLVRSAYKRTTTISANLIECATLGWASEPLVDAVDYIFTGECRRFDCVESMLQWGGTSGTDFLVGVVLAALSVWPGMSRRIS